MAYRIEFTPAAQRQFRKLAPGIRKRLAPVIEGLEADPRPAGATGLTGLPQGYRLRVGDYRIIYQLLDARLLVLVVRIGHRREVYRGLG